MLFRSTRCLRRNSEPNAALAASANRKVRGRQMQPTLGRIPVRRSGVRAFGRAGVQACRRAVEGARATPPHNLLSAKTDTNWTTKRQKIARFGNFFPRGYFLLPLGTNPAQYDPSPCVGKTPDRVISIRNKPEADWIGAMSEKSRVLLDPQEGSVHNGWIRKGLRLRIA